MEKFHHVCVDCGEENHRDEYLRNCVACGGLLEIRYNKPDEFFDSSKDSVWRFHSLLPINNLDNALDLKVVDSPLIRSRAIAEEISPDAPLEELYIKVESAQPTKTFKDREAFMTLSRLRELGYDELVTATTGDSGLAHARGAAMTGALKLHVYVPGNAVPRWEKMMERAGVEGPNVITHVEGETFDKAIEAAGEFAKERSLPLEYGFFNPLRIEGMKTIGFEVLEKLDKVDAYVQAVASGVGVYAFYKAHKDLGKPVPRLYCIQPGGCCPMVDAWKGREIVEKTDTHALGIANPKLYISYPYLKRIIKENGGSFESVFEGKDDELKHFDRLQRLYREDGVEDAGVEAMIALGGLEKLVGEGEIAPEDTVVLNCSGGMRADY